MKDTKILFQEEIFKKGLIPLFYNNNLEICKSISLSIMGSGCSIIEFGLREKNSINLYKKLYEFTKNKNQNIFFGAGSVTDPNLASKIIDIGADFIISPGFDMDILQNCNKSRISYVPGAATVSEIMHLNKLGLELIKIFPARELGGLDFFKAIRGPLPWLNGIPAGGVRASEQSLSKWFKAGAVALTLGSDLFQKDLIESGHYSKIEAKLSSLNRKALKEKKYLLKI